MPAAVSLWEFFFIVLSLESQRRKLILVINYNFKKPMAFFILFQNFCNFGDVRIESNLYCFSVL